MVGSNTNSVWRTGVKDQERRFKAAKPQSVSHESGRVIQDFLRFYCLFRDQISFAWSHSSWLLIRH